MGERRVIFVITGLPSEEARAEESERIVASAKEEALAAASEHGDMSLTLRLLTVLADPFTERAGLERYALPAAPELAAYSVMRLPLSSTAMPSSTLLQAKGKV
mgnify:CR=1 FL=1